jgi:hypothetical protein
VNALERTQMMTAIFTPFGVYDLAPFEEAAFKSVYPERWFEELVTYADAQMEKQFVDSAEQLPAA